MFKKQVALSLVGLLILAILVFAPAPTAGNAVGIVRLYGVDRILTRGTEVGDHTLTHASDNVSYQIDSEKVGANYVINVIMIYSTTVDPANLTQIYVFSEAHIKQVSHPVAIRIYNYNVSSWELCFKVDTMVDTDHSYTINMSLTNYVGPAGEMKLQVYYSVKLVSQSIYQDHTYIELTVPPQSPVADFTWEPETPYTGDTVTFNATYDPVSGLGSYDPDGTIVNMTFNFGDGAAPVTLYAEPWIITHSYADNGTYTVTLTVTDNDGLNGTDSDTITVLNRPPVVTFTENATIVLTYESIHFDASGSYDLDGNITSYFWDFGDGTNATTVTVDHAYEDDGNYTVTLTVTDDDGATNSTSYVKYVSNRPPVASIWENATAVDTGVIIHFDASGSYDLDGNITSYFWDFGDGTNATGVTADHAYADNGTYTVTLTVTDDDGAIDTATSPKNVSNRPPVASFTQSATMVLTGVNITFDASGSSDPDGEIVSYAWDFGDGVTEIYVKDVNLTAIATHSYADNGTYTVTLTVTDDDGAIDTATSPLITVFNRSPVANFTWEPEVPKVNEVVTFNATASYDPDGNVTSYYWDFGDETNATVYEPIVNHTYTTIGDFMVTLTVTDDDGATNSTSATLTVAGRDVAVYLPIVVTFPYNATEAYPGWLVNISVTVGNEGPVAETFWVALYYNLTATEWVLIGNETVTDLPPLTNKTLTFVWDTTGVPPSIVNGNYTIYTFNATASTVPYEVDTTNNVLVGGAVWIKKLGDVNGDGLVSVPDMVLVQINFGKSSVEFPQGDVNGDGLVSVPDLVLVQINFGK